MVKYFSNGTNANKSRQKQSKTTFSKLKIGALCMMLAVLAACVPSTGDLDTLSTTTPPLPEGVTLNVTTTFGADDGGRKPYEMACAEWERRTGNIISDSSGNSNEYFKAKVITDFETGAEPDVLFYFNGADANQLVRGKKVVAIEEILTEYPGFIEEHNIEDIPASLVDLKAYAVPMYGFWELMYVNKNVLRMAGASTPTTVTTWDDFVAICDVVKNAGFTPIAVSLYEVPHYWFEYAVLNAGGVDNHFTLPTSSTDPIGKNWVAGLNCIRDFYERGFFPSTTLTASDAQVWQMFYDDEAAFAIDGSWKLGNIEMMSGHPDDFTVCYVPGTSARKSTDIISGCSSGWYVTRKAWDDPEKRSAAVDFVDYMTSNEVITTFDADGLTVSLKTGVSSANVNSKINSDSIRAFSRRTDSVPPIQDSLTNAQRNALFSSIKEIVTGEISAERALDDAILKTK